MASQNGAIPHINRSIYSIEATSKSSVFTVIYSSVLILLKKAKLMDPYEKNMLFMDPVCDSFPFYKRTVQSRTGTEITRQTALSSFVGRSHVNA